MHVPALQLSADKMSGPHCCRSGSWFSQTQNVDVLQKAFPQNFLPQNGRSSKPPKKAPLCKQGRICVLGYDCINTNVSRVLECFGVAPALSHALDMTGMLPEHLLTQELDRNQFKLSRMAPECGQN